ncbi:MAG: peptidase, partial [Bacteroidetes bacterium]
MTGKTILGRGDRADFPQLGLENIEIKIDTGAYTSSIHCHQIQEVIHEDRRMIRFRLLDPSHPKYHDRV